MRLQLSIDSPDKNSLIGNISKINVATKGTIWAVKKNVGDQVKQGDVLALVDAAEVGQLKSQLLKAKTQLDLNTKTFQRFSKLGGDIIPEQKIQEAKAAKSDAEFQAASDHHPRLLLSKDIAARSEARTQLTWRRGYPPRPPGARLLPLLLEGPASSRLRFLGQYSLVEIRVWRF